MNDLNILRIEPWTQSVGDIATMNPLEENAFDEYWSFWGIEKAFQDIEGKRRRLRYHLGHVLFVQQLKKLHNQNNRLRIFLLDYRGTGEGRADWSEEDINTAESFLKLFLDASVIPERIFKYMDLAKKSSVSKFYEDIKSQVYALTEPIQAAYDELVKNEHTKFYLHKYRDLRIGDLRYIPPCLRDVYEKSSVYRIVPPHIFFASVFALYTSYGSQTKFVNGFWVQEGFPFLACIQKFEDKKICIIEGKRSAYVWLFIDYLRIMYEYKNECKLDLPKVGYLDSLPSLQGAPFMQLNEPHEALFLDSLNSEIKRKISRMSEVMRREYSVRLFHHVQPDSPKWAKEAVAECACLRSKVEELPQYRRCEQASFVFAKFLKDGLEIASTIIGFISNLKSLL